jgi:hypothetical protein
MTRGRLSAKLHDQRGEQAMDMMFGSVSEIAIEICQLSVRASLAQVLDILDDCRAAQRLVSVNIFVRMTHLRTLLPAPAMK